MRAAVKTYVILGGNGVFGVQTAKALLERGAVRKMICVGRNPQRSEAFTLGIDRDPRYAYHQINVARDLDQLLVLLDRECPDVIVNYAALAYATSWDNPAPYYETNVMALVRLVEAVAKRDYLKRFIQIGTSELYGSTEAPAREDAPLHPTSPYAVSKMAGDLHLETMWAVRRFPMNILRPSNAYAPGQLLYRVLPRAVLCGLTGKKLPLEGGGRARKGYLHARDVGLAVLAIAEKAPLGALYNCGPDETVSIRDLVGRVAAALGLRFEDLVTEVPGREYEDAQYWVDSGKIRHELGWRPSISLDAGIQEMIDWGRKYLDVLKDEPTEFVLRP
ncbi:MAG: NAD-dependent epimerase/dehydratase family protein [Alphaproteobacteria bacterium]|nr:NAD-dependent epimerase/dehydratase family protein [Alphaproteobacteria bacterium]